MGSSADMRLTARTSCAAQAGKACVSLFMKEPSRRPKPRGVWSCKWRRSVPLLSDTFLFAKVRPYLNQKRFWNPVPEGPRMDRTCVSISLLLLYHQAGGKMEDGSVHPSCHSRVEEMPNTGDRKTLGPWGHTEISRNVDVKSYPRPRCWALSQSLWRDKLKVKSLYYSRLAG